MIQCLKNKCTKYLRVGTNSRLTNEELSYSVTVLIGNWEPSVQDIALIKPMGQRMLTQVFDTFFQVLQIHSDFLSTCLNDCLLSNPQLLVTVKKLMGICCDFCDYIQVRVSSINDVTQFWRILDRPLPILSRLLVLSLLTNPWPPLLRQWRHQWTPC